MTLRQAMPSPIRPARARDGMAWRLPATMAALAVAGAAQAQSLAPDASDAAALPALTRPASTVEWGAGGLGYGRGATGDPYRIDAPDTLLISNFDLRGSQYSFGNDQDDRVRWRLTGSQLGLRSNRLSGEYGQQGTYRITFVRDESWRQGPDGYQTPMRGAGGTDLTLPGGFVRAADTAGMATLSADMRSFTSQTSRRRAEVGLSYWATPELELRFGLRSEQRDGTRLRGLEFGNNGGNARSMILPEPLDASTQLIDASLGYADEGYRIEIAYHGSMYRNQVGALRWQNPYSSAPWTGGATGLPANFGLPGAQASVAPDNDFHQLSATGAFELSTTTRLTLAASHGRMTQNEAFLPYTVNPGLVTTALPRASLGGVVDTTFFLARLSLRPLRKLSVHASLRHEARDNHTPQSEYIYVGGDSQLQPLPASNSDRIRTNLPRSRRLQQATLDADYHLPDGLVAKAGWDHEVVRRTYAEVESVQENGYRLELRTGSTGPWSGSARVTARERRGSQYLYNLPFLASYSSSAFIDALAAANGCTVPLDCVRSGPLQNKLFLADRDRQQLQWTLGYTPLAPWSAQARVETTRDRYPHSPYGVVGANGWSAGADLSYVPDEDWNANLFAALESQRTSERSRQIASANPAVVSTADSDWFNRFADRTATLGAGLQYKGLLGGRLELAAEALLMHGRSSSLTTVGPAVTPAQNPATPLPDLHARSSELSLAARWRADRHSAWRLAYTRRQVASTDWALQQVGASTLPNLVGTLQSPARYTVQGLALSYIHQFH